MPRKTTQALLTREEQEKCKEVIRQLITGDSESRNGNLSRVQVIPDESKPSESFSFSLKIVSAYCPTRRRKNLSTPTEKRWSLQMLTAKGLKAALK
jgi:hypothetical protein